MRWMRPPRRSMSRSPVAVSTAPEPKNKRLLKSEWLSTCSRPAVSASAAAARHAVGLEGERKSEPDEDDPDVLHRVIGEQALEIVLHQRIEHAHHAGDARRARARRCSTTTPAAPSRSKHDAHESVDGDLGHHAAHQCGDVTRRCRMRERKPGMQRHEARLRAGADQRPGSARARRSSGRDATVRIASKPYVALGTGKQAEGEQQRQRAEARHDEIDVAGMKVFASRDGARSPTPTT